MTRAVRAGFDRLRALIAEMPGTVRYILIFVILLDIAVGGFLLATGGQGEIVLAWNGYDIRMSLGIALIIVSAMVTVLGVIWAMMFGIVRLLSR